MLTMTQKLKKVLLQMQHDGASFTQERLGVGQEFVSIIQPSGQENISKLQTYRSQVPKHKIKPK
jgi:glutamine cyclotransferase